MDAMNEETIEARSDTKWLSVNQEVVPLVDALIRDAQALRLDVTQGPLGETLIDCGVRAVGGLEAGRRIGEICLGGLGRVSLEAADPSSSWPFIVTVHTSQPVLACLGSQYAGWSLSVEDKGKKYHVLGSGPARALGSSGKALRRARLPGQGRSAPALCSKPTARLRPRSSSMSPRPARFRPTRSPSSTRRHRASPARCRSPRAASRSLCIRRMSSIFRCTTSSTAWRPRRCRRPHQASSPPWDAPTTPSSMAGACSSSSRVRPRPPRRSPTSCRASSRRTMASRSPTSSPR